VGQLEADPVTTDRQPKLDDARSGGVMSASE
jgi:hypothetical protein